MISSNGSKKDIIPNAQEKSPRLDSALTDTLAGKDSVLPPQLMSEMAGSLILRAAGEDTEREGVRKTPQRFAKAMKHLTSGYTMTAREAVGEGVFEAEGSGLVCVRNVEFYSLCEHHMLPFWGKASVAYYPNKKILGLSKIPRIVEVFARRFQVQERLTREVSEAVKELIEPRAVVTRVKACHLCMMMRGVEKQQSDTITESSLGLEQLSEIEQKRLWAALDSSD
jgi:GTP cyclohydrolase I